MSLFRPIPRVVLAYGLLGLIPFLAPPLAALAHPVFTQPALLFQALYAALILSFLGGTRFGFAIRPPAPAPATISLTMLPTLAGLALLLLPGHLRALQLLGFAAALLLHWLWDARATGLPTWYPRLRAVLSLGASLGLFAGAALA
jgi:hypothetical protein